MQYEELTLSHLQMNDELLNETKSTNEQPLDCSSVPLPSTGEYYAGPLAVIVPVVLLSTLATMAVGAVYVSTMRYVQLHTPQVLRGYTSFVISIYPVSASVAYVSVLVPRTFPVVQLVMQAMFVVCFYQLFSLLVCHFDSKQQELSSQLVATTLRPATGPCCCCSCCGRCLKPVPLTRGSVKRVRLLVLQLPVVQWMIYLATFIILFERAEVLEVVNTWLQVLFLVSILLAAWGTSMLTGMLNSVSKDFHPKSKFAALQTHVGLHALLSIIGDTVTDYLPCTAPLTPSLWSNLTLSSLLLLELVALSLWARRLYCRESTPVVTLGYQPRRDAQAEAEAGGGPEVASAVVTTQPRHHNGMQRARDRPVNSITIVS
ncbi:organic solute transporter alpha-like protein [Schistocerca serialis cubense]|uniref:organic solute transporter alpha-like protein n=1 Tax=Schistocerca serialis cubense TaxID=2023355 RepID=UPI00214F483A|nr:organic solute transporter alpha-like protein [Schistocerca serialis cubense]